MVNILALVPAEPVFILATLLSFTVKLAETDGGVISNVWGLVAGNGCTILGLVRVQQELHGQFLSGHAVRSFYCIQADDIQLGGGR